MKKILLILVGGTICTSVNENGKLDVDAVAGSKLRDYFLRSDSVFAKEVRIDLTENLYVLSENMTVDRWREMLSTYLKYISRERYDGVIFAHGTDTLAYSAALFSILLNRTDLPVFFVSGNKRLDDPASNGHANFRAAAESILYGIRPGVYVTYRNTTDGKMRLHLASRLRQCENYSEDFTSAGEIVIGGTATADYEAGFRKLSEQYPARERAAAFPDLSKVKLTDCVLYLQPYVGINYEAYRYDRFKAVLHGTFHSGTACAEKSKEHPGYGRNSVLRLIDLAAKAKTDIYLSPAKPEGETYDSVRMIGEHETEGRKIRFLYGTTNEMAYVKLLLAYSNFGAEEEIEGFLGTAFSEEFIYE